MMQSLITLLQPFALTRLTESVDILSITQDSRLVEKGSLFIAYKGLAQDGRQYIENAVARGAAAIVYEASDDFVLPVVDIPAIPMIDVAEKLGLIAARFYQYPSEDLCMVGVTGTNGKTSVTYFIAQALTALQQRCGIIGTTGYGFLPELHTSTQTTPDAVTLQKHIAELAKEKAKTIAMEVSSHGLDQARLQGVAFDYAIFTNLTRDHLDYHGTFAAYQAAKEKLFTQWPLKAAIFNLEDAVGALWFRTLQSRYPVLGYRLQPSCEEEDRCVSAEQIKTHVNGFSVTVRTPWGTGEFNTRLLGEFNIANVLAVIAVLGQMGYSLAQILPVMSQLQTVPGRMQLLQHTDAPTVVIDYAHTPDALEKALRALRQHCQARIFCIFGCGGDRDKGKRAQMAQVVEAGADQMIVTNDNPRHEDPNVIIQEIMTGFINKESVTILPDREKAIHYALKTAKTGDVILIAGKGHETYQIIGDTMHDFSDAQCVQDYWNS